MRSSNKKAVRPELHPVTETISPIRRRKLYQEILDRLLARIRAGEFPPGSQLPSERQLMESYAVGRPAVREALFTLQRMGLISITHGDRARLVTVSADTAIGQVSEMARFLLETSPGSLDHLKDARLFFEVAMVRIAAQKATAGDIARLRGARRASRGIERRARIPRQGPGFSPDHRRHFRQSHFRGGLPRDAGMAGALSRRPGARAWA